MDDRTKERIGGNEAAFRSVNEKLRESSGLALANRLFPFTCECGLLGCNRLVEMTTPEYETVRRDPQLFLIVDGHEIPDAEQVIARHERYTVVRKENVAGRVAQATDPRT